MENKRDVKRADLQRRLVDAAEHQIAAGGLSALKAREVTAQAGCALGALYTAFDDLDTLVLHVNARTLGRLGAVLADAATKHDDADDILQALAATYVGFATDNRRLWMALYEHHLPEGVATPEWYQHDNLVLVEQLIEPLARVRPDLDQDALYLRARTTFSAVHGVVLLALEGRYIGVPQTALATEVAALVEVMTRGTRLAGGT